MQTEDFPRLRAVFDGMSKLFGKPIDGSMLDIYWLTLRDWPLDEFERAAAHLLTTAHFMPKPADFHALRKATGMSPSEAWAVALTHAAGAYRAGPSVPEVERAVAAMGGWRAIAMASTDSLAFVEKRFLEAFKELGERTESREALTALPSKGTGRGRLEKAADRLPVGLRIVHAET